MCVFGIHLPFCKYICWGPIKNQRPVLKPFIHTPARDSCHYNTAMEETVSLGEKRAQSEEPQPTTGSMEVALPPTPKRPRVNEAGSAETQVGVTDCVLRQSMDMIYYLDSSEVLKASLIPILTFLTNDETEKLEHLMDLEIPTERIVRRLIQFIKRQEGDKRDSACRKLVACVILTKENHLGHVDLDEIFSEKLPDHEHSCIQQLVSEAKSTQKPLAPEKPVPFIKIEGILCESFSDTERVLWEFFSIGDYKKLEDKVIEVFGDPTLKAETDCRLVALWFKSLIVMHTYGEYSRAIEVLNDALELCGDMNCVNRTILEGRIYQRMSQNYLMKGRKHVAMLCFERAKDRLHMVGIGYDKANMFCREAKILSAQETESRVKIEKMYENALCVLKRDDPYFLASFPSITLSKAAFYLRVSFGSKAGSHMPQVDTADIRKAEETLATVNESKHILLEMRQFEYSFLRAELYRLRGREREARELFRELTSTPGSSKVENILSLAEQRLKSIDGLP